MCLLGGTHSCQLSLISSLANSSSYLLPILENSHRMADPPRVLYTRAGIGWKCQFHHHKDLYIRLITRNGLTTLRTGFIPPCNETRRSLYSANAAPASPTISINQFDGSTPYCSKQFADTANSHLSEISALARRRYIRNTHYKIHSLCGVRRPRCHRSLNIR